MQVELTQKLTTRTFAINFTNRTFNEPMFRFVIKEAKPKIISYALGNRGGLVKWAHDGGILFIQQLHTTKQAGEAAKLEVCAIIAQGTEAGGFFAVV